MNEPVRVPISLNREVNGSQQCNDNLLHNKVARNYQNFCPARGLQSIFVSAFHHSFIILVSWTIWMQEQLYFQPSLTNTSKLQKLFIGRAKRKYFPKITEWQEILLNTLVLFLFTVCFFQLFVQTTSIYQYNQQGQGIPPVSFKKSGTIYQQTWQQTGRYTGAQLQNANKFCYDS